MKRIVLAALLASAFSTVDSQEQRSFVRTGLLRTDASFVSGYMFRENLQNVHISGSAEYYVDDQVSIRGSGTYLLGSTTPDGRGFSLEHFHSLMLGGAWHLPVSSHWDPYLVVQPGLAITSGRSHLGTQPGGDNPMTRYQPQLTPLGTAGLGFNYYFQRFAHLFAEARYAYGVYLSDASEAVSLEELRITFGLGFNLHTIRNKKESRS